MAYRLITLLLLALLEASAVRPTSQHRDTSPLIPTRALIAAELETEHFTTGIELGVQLGDFAAHNLANWPSCKKYHLVDIWHTQENYADQANVDEREQETRYEVAQDRLRQWSNITEFHRMYTTEAAPLFEKNSADFIYVDARHDYCGVKEDIETYWPKLKPGGIMAGHDFLDAAQVASFSNQDWSLCGNGEHHVGAVRGAVSAFAAKHRLHLVATYWREDWPSWILRKPVAAHESASLE